MVKQHHPTRAALGAALVLCITVMRASADQPKHVTEKLDLVTAKGVVTLDVEIADTPARQALGLMYRTELPERGGMLFLHSPPRESTMWMRNTYIPLDMVFIRADGTVHRIAAMTDPHSEELIASNGPVSAVLEIKGGAAQRFGLQIGDKVRHRHFGTAPSP